MKKKVLLAVLVVLLLAPALLMAYPAVGNLAPNFTLPDTALVNHSLIDYRGKVVQLLFWQST
jgi:peroxiredoxin